MNPQISFILLTTLIDALGMGLVLPVLPALLQSLTHKGPAEVSYYYGTLLMGYSAGQFLLAPVLGKLSDRFGRRPVLLISIGGASLNYAIAASTGITGVFVAAHIIAGACGASFATAGAYIADVTPIEKRAENFGMMWATIGVGITVGPLIGGSLTAFGPRTAFWAAAALSTINFAYGLFVVPESRPTGSDRNLIRGGISPFVFVGLLRRSNLSAGLIVAFALSIGAVTAAQSATLLFTQIRFGWTTRQIGLYVTVAGVAAILGQTVLMRWLISRFGKSRVLIAGLLLRSMGWLLTAFAAEAWQIYAILAFAIPGSVVQPLIAGWLSGDVSPAEQGTLQGALTSLGVAAETIGPVAGATVLGYFTRAGAQLSFPGAPFVLSSIVGVGALISLMRWPPDLKEPAKLNQAQECRMPALSAPAEKEVLNEF